MSYNSTPKKGVLLAKVESYIIVILVDPLSYDLWGNVDMEHEDFYKKP